MLIPEESPATIGDISDQTGPGLGSTGGLPFERGGLSAWSIKKTFHTTVTVWISNLSDKRQRMLACEFPFPIT